MVEGGELETGPVPLDSALRAAGPPSYPNVVLVLRLKELAEYEKLSHQVKISEEGGVCIWVLRLGWKQRMNFWW